MIQVLTQQRLIQGFLQSRLVGAAVVLGVLLHVGCANPSKPSTDPTISCPAGETEETLNGSPVAVRFPDPVVSGGESPVTTTCSPPSGSNFAVGTTVVRCTSRDAKGQTASCSFPVTVSNVPQIAATTYLAFGDSITEGEIDSTCAGTRTLTPGEGRRGSQANRTIVDPTRSFPTKLLAFLSARYPVQNFRMVNAGLSGETAEQGSARLPAVLTAQQPQVLLLQEGANDLRSISLGTPPHVAMLTVINSLRAMIQEARQRGTIIFVATLLPQRPGACHAYSPDYIAPANDMIRVMVGREGAGVTLVDLYAAFGGIAGDLVGTDGLHPNEAGYQKIAETFFDGIQHRLESQSAAPAVGWRRSNPQVNASGRARVNY